MKSILPTFRFAARPLVILAAAATPGCDSTAPESTGDSGTAALQEILQEARGAAEKGQYPQSEERFAAALAEANSSGAEPLMLVRILQSLARVKAVQGRIESADSLHHQALALLEEGPEDLGVSGEDLLQALGSLGNLALARGDLDTAEWRFRQIQQRGAEGEISLQPHDLALAVTVSGLAKVARAKSEAEALDLEVLAPDVNRSGASFVHRGSQIVFGLGTVKTVGEQAVAAILEAREDGGPFESLADLCARVDGRVVTRRTVEPLIKVGALDALGERNALLEGLEAAFKRGQQARNDRVSGQTTMFEMAALPASASDDERLPDVEEASNGDRRRWEKDLLGLHVSPSPLSNPGVREALRASVDTQIFDLEATHLGQTLTVGGLVADVRQLITQKGDTMAIVTLEDAPGTIEVVVFPRIWSQIGDSLEIDRVIVARGRLEDRRGSLQLVAENLYPPQPAAEDSDDAAVAHEVSMPDDAPEAQTDAPAVPDDVGLEVEMAPHVEAAVNGDSAEAATAAPTADAEAPVEPSPVVGSLEVQAAGSEYMAPSDEEAPAASVNGDDAPAASGEANGATSGGAPTRVVVVLRRSPDLGHDIDLLRRLSEAAAAHPGEVPLELHVEAPDGDVTRLRWPTTVSASPELVAQVAREYEPDNVAVERTPADSA